MTRTFHRTAEAYRQGAHTMPGEFYTSPAILVEENERIFAQQWNCVGRTSAVPNPGDFIVRMVAGESIIIVRERGGELRAFFNVCRHRGTRICRQSLGRFSETIQCPYHAWTWTIDGRCIGAPHMNEIEGFDKKDYPLHRAALAEWEGFLFVNIAREPEPFAESHAPLIGRFERFGLPGLRVGHRVTDEVQANWKLVFQNYSECQHCPMIHPELSVALAYQSGANDLIDGPFLGGYMEILPPNASATMSGRLCGMPVSESIPAGERQRAYYYTLMPNLLLSLHVDYVNYYLVTPVSPTMTTVESEWLFHPDNDVKTGFDPQDAIEFWDRTNRQDWDISAQSQLGVSSRRYEPGPYSPRESMPAAWDREYLRMMGMQDPQD